MKSVRMRYIRRAVLAFLFIGIEVCRRIPGAGEWYAREVYPLVSFLLSGVAAAVPFSLCEVVVVGAFLFLVAYPLVARHRKKAWRVIAGIEVEVVLWIYVWFYWGWGMNYFRDDFFVRSGVERVPYGDERFRSFAYGFADSLNAAYRMRGACTEEETRREVKRVYAEIPVRFGLAVPRGFQQPKRSLVNGLYSKVGVLGSMGPFFDESYVNHGLLPEQYPFTYAHELSHLLGVSVEAEANFWAYQVCIRSTNSFVRYCGYFGLLPYIYRDARVLLDEADFKAWAERIDPEVIRMRRRQEAYWEARYSRLLGKMQDVVYDWYLKGNRIPSGRKNYGEVVAMILALPDGWEK